MKLIGGLLLASIVFFMVAAAYLTPMGFDSAFSTDFLRYLILRPLAVLGFKEEAGLMVRYPRFVSFRMFRSLTLENQEKVLEVYGQQLGSQAARTYLLSAYPQQPFGLHDLGHIIGEGIYRDYGSDALATCDSSFTFSCYHGVIMGFVRTHGFDRSAVEQFAYAGCKQEPTIAEFHGCYHGFGHALMMFNSNDLGVSLKECDALVRDPGVLFDCYQGASMENAQFSFAGREHIVDINTDDLYYPCSTFDKKYASACYSEHLARALRITGGGPEQAASYCFNIPVAGSAEKEMCFARIGIYIGAQAAGGHAAVVKACMHGKEYAYACLANYARHRSLAGDNEGVRIACDSLENSQRESCYAAARIQ